MSYSLRSRFPSRIRCGSSGGGDQCVHGFHFRRREPGNHRGEAAIDRLASAADSRHHVAHAPAIYIRRLSSEGYSAGPCASVLPRAAATAGQRAGPGVLSLTLIGRLTTPAISTEDRWSGGPATSKDSIWAASCSNDS